MIWKYKLEKYSPSAQAIEMPVGSTFLSAATQHGEIAMWFEVPEYEKQREERKFIPIGTGTQIDIPVNERKFLGTALFLEGNFVLHIFEIIPVK